MFKPTVTTTTTATGNSTRILTKADPSKQYRPRVLAGPGSNYQDLRPLNVNDDANPLLIDTDEFVGRITFRVKGLSQVPGYKQGQQEDGLHCTSDSQWFDRSGSETNNDSNPSKNNNLSCIQIVGRFKREWSGDQLLFGSVFDDRIKRLPPFTSVGVKILHYLDPGIKIDLTCERPYILSPLIVSMNKVHVSSSSSREKSTAGGASDCPKWPSPNGEHVVENTRLLFKDDAIDTVSISKEGLETLDDDDLSSKDTSSSLFGSTSSITTKRRKNQNTTSPLSSLQSKPMTAKERQHYFAKPKNLSKHKFRTDQDYAFEFLGPGSYVDFGRFKVKFAGFTIDALRCWDGQPCKFMLTTADLSTTFFTLWIEPVVVQEK
ncbi:hypothetical protein BGX27_007274 [Mortierella sp. AM989]|nr:hypothetical protein BGX27_007274 [Mortierella sp. AM989]